MVWLFTLVYFVSYITRINYGAIISEMEAATALPRTMLSMAVTGSFITYGIGQIISGICGDRIAPKKLIQLGLLVTSSMNLLIPFVANPYAMLAVWCVNGFAQAFMWPPLVKMMTMVLSEEEYDRAVVRVSWGSSFGTIAVYLIAPLIISLADWKVFFLICSVCGMVMSIIWYKKCPEIAEEWNIRKGKRKSLGEKVPAKLLWSPLIIGIMFSIILQGVLRDGVTTWIPSYIVETYDLSSVTAILTSVVLPVFSIFCYSLASGLYQKYLKNPLLCAGAFFAVGAIAAICMNLITGKSAVGSLCCAAILTGCMHGVNLMLISTVPKYFKRWGSVSTVSGLLNCCTYIGSAISTYGIAFLSVHFGWNMTLRLWVLIAASGALLCVLGVKKWKTVFYG